MLHCHVRDGGSPANHVMGTLASQPVRQALATFLKMNRDVFAWSHEDIPGIDPLVIIHRLNVNLAYSPIR